MHFRQVLLKFHELSVVKLKGVWKLSVVKLKGVWELSSAHGSYIRIIRSYLRLTVLQWMSESMLPQGTSAWCTRRPSHPCATGGSIYDNDVYVNDKQQVWWKSMAHSARRSWGNSAGWWFQIFQRLNSQATRFSRFF